MEMLSLIENDEYVGGTVLQVAKGQIREVQGPAPGSSRSSTTALTTLPSDEPTSLSQRPGP